MCYYSFHLKFLFCFWCRFSFIKILFVRCKWDRMYHLNNTMIFVYYTMRRNVQTHLDAEEYHNIWKNDCNMLTSKLIIIILPVMTSVVLLVFFLNNWKIIYCALLTALLVFTLNFRQIQTFFFILNKQMCLELREINRFK